MGDENVYLGQELGLGHIIVDSEVFGDLLEGLLNIHEFAHRHDDLILLRASESLDTAVIELKIPAEDSSQ